jgi:hypothetical protein
MKKISITFASILIIFLIAITGFSENNLQQFSGRVINLTDEYIEVKKGRTEIILYITDDSKFIAKDGNKAGFDIIEICQYVKADYFKENSKNILDRIVITKESDCIK